MCRARRSGLHDGNNESFIGSGAMVHHRGGPGDGRYGGLRRRRLLLPRDPRLTWLAEVNRRTLGHRQAAWRVLQLRHSPVETRFRCIRCGVSVTPAPRGSCPASIGAAQASDLASRSDAMKTVSVLVAGGGRSGSTLARDLARRASTAARRAQRDHDPPPRRWTIPTSAAWSCSAFPGSSRTAQGGRPRGSPVRRLVVTTMTGTSSSASPIALLPRPRRLSRGQRRRAAFRAADARQPGRVEPVLKAALEKRR